MSLRHAVLSKIPEGIRARVKWLLYLLRRPSTPSGRFDYQTRYIKHVFLPDEMVLDIGSGGYPFPYATVLGDRYLEPTRHRQSEFRTLGKPVVICDVAALPFRQHQFNYVVCSHVLEHVDDPIRSCAELQRVSQAGFIETPTLMKDALFAWAKNMHKWHVTSIANRLVFFEYSERLAEGVRSEQWYQLIFGRIFHPLQTVFNDNQDIFNIMLEWTVSFEVTVMLLDGTITELTTEIKQQGPLK